MRNFLKKRLERLGPVQAFGYCLTVLDDCDEAGQGQCRFIR